MKIQSRNAICLLAAVLSLVVMAPSCHAGTVVAQVAPYLGNIEVLVNNGNVQAPAWVGAYTWATIGGNAPSFPVGSVFTAFCIDLGTMVQTTSIFTPGSFSTSNSNLPSNLKATTDPAAAARIAAISRLWGGFYSQLNTYNNNDPRVNAAAFQLAIWTLEYNLDSSGHVTGTTFQASVLGAGSQDAIDLAQQLVTKSLVGGEYSNSAATNLIALTTGSGQDQLTATPEPSTLCLGAIGIGMLITAGVKRRRKAVVV